MWRPALLYVCWNGFLLMTCLQLAGASPGDCESCKRYDIDGMGHTDKRALVAQVQNCTAVVLSAASTLAVGDVVEVGLRCTGDLQLDTWFVESNVAGRIIGNSSVHGTATHPVEVMYPNAWHAFNSSSRYPVSLFFHLRVPGIFCLSASVFGYTVIATAQPILVANGTAAQRFLGSRTCLANDSRVMQAGLWVGGVWRPWLCEVRLMTHTDVQACLRNKTIVFQGDSLVRAVILGMAMTLVANDVSKPEIQYLAATLNHKSFRDHGRYIAVTMKETNTTIIWCGSIGTGELLKGGYIHYDDFPSESLNCLSRDIQPDVLISNVYLHFTKFHYKHQHPTVLLQRYSHKMDFFATVVQQVLQQHAGQFWLLTPPSIWTSKQPVWVPSTHNNHIAHAFRSAAVNATQAHGGYIWDVSSMTALRPDQTRAPEDGVHYKSRFVLDHWMPAFLGGYCASDTKAA